MSKEFEIGRNVKRARKAGVTVEVAVTTLLSITVLLLVLGLFNQNINVLAANGNFNNLLNRKQATAQSFTNKDYKNSQIDVRIVADQGLQAYLDKTQKSIDGLMAQTTTITDPQRVDLAKYETVKSIMYAWQQQGSSQSLAVNWSSEEKAFCTANGLMDVPFRRTYLANGKTPITLTNGTDTNSINWQTQSAYTYADVGNGANPKTKEQLQVVYLSEISSKF